jgi:hypothetical protein
MKQHADAIPCNWEFAPGDGPTGTVKLRMSNHGDLEIRYFDVAADRPRIRLPIHVHSRMQHSNIIYIFVVNV